MAHSTMLHVRVDDEINTQANEALAAMGPSVSDAVRIQLQRVVNDQAFSQGTEGAQRPDPCGNERSPSNDEDPCRPFSTAPP